MEPLGLVSTIIGILLVLIGLVWTLQGTNVLGGSRRMSGNPKYIYLGGLVSLIGLVPIVLGSV
jgi:uncharacterized membrane protein